MGMQAKVLAAAIKKALSGTGSAAVAAKNDDDDDGGRPQVSDTTPV
jgi:hypothetical protein